jgi:predicted Zn finger-like uncharacterized protein
MRVTCPSCGYQTTISEEVIPVGGKSVTCPECKDRFDVSRPKVRGAAARGVRIKRLVIAGIALALVSASAFTYYKITTSKSDEDIKNEFLHVIKKHIDQERDKEDYTITFETEKSLRKNAAGFAVTDTVEGWRKYIEKDNLQYEFNVFKTDSIVSPYTGTYTYRIVQYISPSCPSKEGAFKCTDYTYLKSLKHVLNYEYQSGHWILKSDNWEQEK